MKNIKMISHEQFRKSFQFNPDLPKHSIDDSLNNFTEILKNRSIMTPMNLQSKRDQHTLETGKMSNINLKLSYQTPSSLKTGKMRPKSSFVSK